MSAEEGERWIECDEATGDQAAAPSDQGCGVLRDHHNEDRDEDRLNERDPPHGAAAHAERCDEERIARKTERLRHECFSSGGARVLARRDDSSSQCEVLLLIVSDRVPFRREVRAVGKREQKADRRERDDDRVTAKSVGHRRESVSHGARVGSSAMASPRRRNRLRSAVESAASP